MLASRRLLAALALVAALGGRAAAETGQKESGFGLEVHVGTHLVDFGLGAVGAIQGGFFAGWKLGRIFVGLGFDLARGASGTSATMQPDTSKSQTTILFSPGVQVAILRSSDHRVELFGELDFGVGHGFADQNPSPGNQPDRGNYLIVYKIGPGVRLWVTPQFAVGGATGLTGEFLVQSETTNLGGAGSFTQTMSTGATSIFADIKLLAVF